MRIAEIAPPWIQVPPEGYGGIELVVDLLAHGFEARGHDVTLFAPEGSRSAAEVVSPLPAAGSDSIGDRWHEAYHAVSAYQHAEDFDLIHDHTFLGPALAQMRDGGPMTVHTLHGPWDDESSAYYGILDERVHLVAISETQRRGNPDIRYAATIENGIDIERYPLNEGKRENFLVYIGRANEDKAPEVAVELAHRAGLPLKLVVKHAEPDEQRYWEKEVLPRLSEEDEALDEIGHDKKVELLQRGRAFIFPIRWEEPFGLVMVEALACGMPVVATPCGAAREIVADGLTGFLRPELDGLVTCIERAGTISPLACRARVEEHFSAETMVDRYLHLFHALLDDRTRRLTAI
jgi:glycosyltransferase involved in cell wall biosynthesis